MDDLPEFMKALQCADWFYLMSDDPAAYRRGEREIAELDTWAANSWAHRLLFDCMHAWARAEIKKVMG